MVASKRWRSRPWHEEHRPLDMDRVRGGGARLEDRSDGAWYVRDVVGSGKTYRCPGCDQLIAAQSLHVVVWAQDGLFGPDAALDDRRHWHTSCWGSRRAR